jgi:hypothetical protein
MSYAYWMKIFWECYFKLNVLSFSLTEFARGPHREMWQAVDLPICPYSPQYSSFNTLNQFLPLGSGTKCHTHMNSRWRYNYVVCILIN